MDAGAFFESVRAQGSWDGQDVEEVVAAVVAALGELLTADEAAALGAQIPGGLVQWLRPAAKPAAPDVTALYGRVAALAGLSKPHALEATQIVCRTLGADLSPEVRARLAAHLGTDVARLFEAPEAGAPPSRPVHATETPLPGSGRTLATGRPGSRHPLSEAHPETAHAGSVVRSENPHADSKLSSAHGLTQEALHETLADGKPGPARTVADTRD